MDTAVALVKSYLQANGFFTVTEYPILEMLSEHEARTVTDVDVLAIRFPQSGLHVAGTTRGIHIAPDANLGLTESHIEVIIAEVKEGAAVLNRAATHPEVLAAVLRRFGDMRPEIISDLVEELTASGVAFHPAGIRFRLMVFASKPPTSTEVRYEWLSLGSISTWLRGQIRENWDLVKTIQSKDPALGMLILFEKAEREPD